jgi:hypothetical protein
MINGSMDNIIKLSAAEDTWLAFAKTDGEYYPVGHYTSKLMINKAKRLTIEHFNRVLDFLRAGAITRRQDKTMIKHYVLDTNVLLHNPNALFLFQDNHVIIPNTVIEKSTA